MRRRGDSCLKFQKVLRYLREALKASCTVLLDVDELYQETLVQVSGYQHYRNALAPADQTQAILGHISTLEIKAEALQAEAEERQRKHQKGSEEKVAKFMNTLRGSNDHYQQWTKAIIVLLYSDYPGPLTQKSDLDMQVSLLYLASDLHNLFDEYSGIPGKVAHDQAMAVRGEIRWFLDNLTVALRQP